MDSPEREVEGVIRSLTQSSRENQRKALEQYFLPNAYFVHPFCRVPSFSNVNIPLTNRTVNSLWFVFFIYQWYHVLSPDIKLGIDSIAFDKQHNKLYVTLHQTFTLWFVPFSLWQANVKLVTVLNLERLRTDAHGNPVVDEDSPALVNGDGRTNGVLPRRYFIKGQEDHYQIEDFVKFVAPWGASVLWQLWQLFATLVCAVGVALLREPVALLRQNMLGRDSRTIKTKA
ncbi:hypothetical protein GGR52DRAFT_445720 [Hypoxylon sp. FL1284]|nr:hypothetical protein GGR52DRAFT_445720 [Hypoxylon sp. FL1284]